MLSSFASRIMLVAALMTPLSCATSSAKAANGSPPSSSSVIQRNELAAREFTNMFDAIQALRGNWLRARGSDSINKPSSIVIYLDTQKLGGVEQLRAISPRTIASVRRFDGIEATSRWGMDHGAGAIQLTSIR